MIADPGIKNCPFRKEVDTIDYKYAGHGVVTNTAENFLECIENACMAWSKKERGCLLMRREVENKE